jgi:hypothetical protein
MHLGRRRNAALGSPGRKAIPARSVGGEMGDIMKLGPSLAMLAVLASCATSTPGDPKSQCAAALAELSDCREAVQEWQAQGTGQRPACLDETPPEVAMVVASGGQSYPDDPQSRLELQRIAKNLEMADRFLQREKPVEAGLLLGKVEGRCAALP